MRRLVASSVAVLSMAFATTPSGAEFPIGAWFPGLYHSDKAQWSARLDSVLAGGFNTIHAANENNWDPARADTLIDSTSVRGINIQFKSWRPVPADVGGWWDRRHYWAHTFQAEDNTVFEYDTGDIASNAWHCDVPVHSAGDFETIEAGSGIRLRHVDSANYHGTFAFRLKISNISGQTQTVCRVEMRRESDGQLLANPLYIYPPIFTLTA